MNTQMAPRNETPPTPTPMTKLAPTGFPTLGASLLDYRWPSRLLNNAGPAFAYVKIAGLDSGLEH